MTGIELARTNRLNAKNGIANVLPMPFPKLSKLIAGFKRGLNVCISANSGVGKTTLSKFLLISFVDWAIKNNIDLHIRMYLLEESIETFESTIMLNKLYRMKQERISLDTFSSNVRPLSDKHLDLLEDIEENYMTKFRKYVTTIDWMTRPTEIFMDAKEFILTQGTIIKDKNPKTGKEYEKEFIPNNPNAFHVIFLDNVSEFDSEEGLDLGGCMKRWSNYALKDLTKRYNYTIFNVHQQMASNEGTEATKYNKQKPSLQGLGDNKLVGRAYRLCIGLFSPYRQEIPKWGKYVIADENDGYQDYFRNLNVFKNNFGASNIDDGLYFDGMTLHMEEAESATLKNKPKESLN